MNEQRLFDYINKAVRENKNQSVILNLGGTLFSEVTGIRSYTGSLYKTNRSYTDFVLDKRNTKGINISFDSPVFSEDIQKLEIIVPGLRYKFIRAVMKKIKALKIEPGQEVPEIYGKLDTRHRDMLFRGTLALGGPVQYILNSLPNTFEYDYDEDTTTLTIPGNLVSITQYAKEYDVYLKLEPSYQDQKYDPNLQRGGMPSIYGKSETRGEAGNRIQILSQPDKNGIVVNIE